MTGLASLSVDLQNLLAGSTVRITTPSGTGSGFLAGPGLVVTCAHVVGTRAGGPVNDVTVIWNGREYRADLEHGGYFPPPDPDIALLRVPVSGNPYVVFAQHFNVAEINDDIISYGFPETKPAGDYATFQAEGRAPGTHALLKLKSGQAEPGMSGAPALSLTSGAVCGMLRLTRGAQTDLGARAVPAQTILAHVPQLREFQGQQHASVSSWLSSLTDEQLQAGHYKFAGPRLKRYLRSVIATSDEHPYYLTQTRKPPLSAVYLRQAATTAEDVTVTGAPAAAGTGNAVSPRGLIDATSIPYSEDVSMVIAGPGAGKSSLLRNIAVTSAKRWLAGEQQPFVPIRIPAVALTEDATFQHALANGTVHELGATLGDPDLAALFFGSPLADVPWLVMVDGVDEILDSTLRMKVLRAVQIHRESPRYKFLVASRPLPFEELRYLAAGLQQYHLEPLPERMLPVLAAHWFEALGLPDPAGLAQRFRNRIENYRLRQLARIPLIATMICLVYANNSSVALPATRTELYERFVHGLFEKQVMPLNVRSALKIRLRPYGPQAEEAVDRLLDQLRSLLERAAYERQFGSARSILALSLDFAHGLRPRQIGDEPWRDIVREALRQSGLVVERGRDVRFTHQTIEEYLAACHIAARHKPDSRIGGDLIAGTASWSGVSAEVRLFVIGIWARSEQALPTIFQTITQRAKTEDDWGFVASLVLDGIKIPDQYLQVLLGKLQGASRAAQSGSNGLHIAEAAFLVSESVEIRQSIAICQDQNLAFLRRFLAATTLQAHDISAYAPDILQITQSDQSMAIRFAAAIALALSGFSQGQRMLIAYASSPTVAADDRIAAAEALTHTDRLVALTVLSRLSRDQTLPARFQIEAARMASNRNRAQGNVLFEELRLRIDRDCAEIVTLAAALCAREDERGAALLGEAIINPRLNAQTRREATALLRRFYLGSLPYPDRAFWEATAPHLPGMQRAARCQELLSADSPLAEVAYSILAADMFVDDIQRLEATRALFMLKSPSAMGALQLLAADPDVSAEIRTRAGALLGRAG